MNRRWIQLAMVVSFLNSMGAHVAVLQTFAWAKMAVQFAQHDSLSASLQKTFDGKHPCKMCLRLKKSAQPDGSFGIAPSKNQMSEGYLKTPVDLQRIIQGNPLFSTKAEMPDFFVLQQDPPPPKAILS